MKTYLLKEPSEDEIRASLEDAGVAYDMIDSAIELFRFLAFRREVIADVDAATTPEES